MSKTVRAERGDQAIHLAGDYLSHQETPEERSKRYAAVSNGLVIAG